MEYRNIIAIIDPLKLEAVEEQLKKHCVPCLSFNKEWGYNESRNFFKNDWTAEKVRIELFIDADKAQEVAQAIVEAAHTGIEGDGMVAVLPVESLFCVRTKELFDGS